MAPWTFSQRFQEFWPKMNFSYFSLHAQGCHVCPSAAANAGAGTATATAATATATAAITTTITTKQPAATGTTGKSLSL